MGVSPGALLDGGGPREKGLTGPLAPAERMLTLGEGGGRITWPSLSGRADWLPALAEEEPRGDCAGLPASSASVGIWTFSFGRMPADLGSAMLLLRLGGGGGEVLMGGGADFSSFVAATFSALLRWIWPTSTE